MPLRNSLGFPNPGLENGGRPRSVSLLERIYDSLLAAYQVVHKLVPVVYWLVVGGVLILLPWTDFWHNNYLLYRFPGLRPFMLNPFLKGAILGLGVVDVLIGLQEIVRFRKGSGAFVPR
ncbi:MAG: hypothetical protein LAP85_02130 [Acidobacteriia bacterium]|nr:hypothetical protein [Terriglobia bacterium]